MVNMGDLFSNVFKSASQNTEHLSQKKSFVQ